MAEFERRRLGKSSVEVSRLGIGTVPLAGFKAKVTFSEAQALVKDAFDGGIRHFDTAPMYGFGKAEYNLGHALHELGIRDQVVVSTKVGRVLKAASRVEKMDTVYGIDWVDPLPFLDTYDYTYDGFMRSFEDSQKRLALDYIDVLLVHDLGRSWHGDNADIYWKQIRESGYKALDELRSSGAVGAVGLGVNETESVVTTAREFDIDCALIAGRYTLLNHAPPDGDFDELNRRDVSVIAAGVFNSGILATGVKARGASYDYGRVPTDVATKVAAIEDVCATYRVSLPAAAIQFSNAHPAVASIVLGAASAQEVRHNVASFSEYIPDEFWAELKQKGLLPDSAPVPTA
ncbi:aldo/keto reductase [Agrobacterium tumefaciens]|uniref:aldo/keto reductase n=1 Tax=Agrobacterium tumefaciens TaxID=358 RepID=UPI0012B84F28|nr:aldo/keto reductase [Agrobacterium tumefaciens]MQB08022.1 aldo/keto reductase [Agrobacterium tumefaciens]